jgi:hypothetical protein
MRASDAVEAVNAAQIPLEHHAADSALEQCIEDWILELDNDWDDEGAAKYDPRTWQRAVGLVRLLTALHLQIHGVELLPSSIAPAGKGSIDLYWSAKNGTLLISVPCDPQQNATYYGQNTSGDNTISGFISTSQKRPDIAAWIQWIQ